MIDTKQKKALWELTLLHNQVKDAKEFAETNEKILKQKLKDYQEKYEKEPILDKSGDKPQYIAY